MITKSIENFLSVDPSHLGEINEQTEEICLFSVRQYSTALSYVKNQTDIICL